VILGQDDGGTPSAQPNGYVPALYLDSTGHLRASMFYHGGIYQEVSSAALNDGNWTCLVI